MLRVGMTNPPYILEHIEAIGRLLNHPRCYAFLHVPSQSGSTRTLTAMRREYTAAEFALVADEIAATVDVQALLETPRRARADLYPETLHGMTALVYALVAEARPETLPEVIDVQADIAHLKGAAHRSLPLQDLTSFGFEILIRKALEAGWQQAFAESQSYAEYARSREEAGLQ